MSSFSSATGDGTGDQDSRNPSLSASSQASSRICVGLRVSPVQPASLISTMMAASTQVPAVALAAAVSSAVVGPAIRASRPLVAAQVAAL